MGRSRCSRWADFRTIAIAERPGNRRVDGYRNILADPRVGLLFVIPGRGDTLRVNGRARIVREAPFFDDLVVKGHRPALAIVVDIDERHAPVELLGVQDPLVRLTVRDRADGPQ